MNVFMNYTVGPNDLEEREALGDQTRQEWELHLKEISKEQKIILILRDRESVWKLQYKLLMLLSISSCVDYSLCWYVTWLGLLCFMPLSTVLQLYDGCQFDWWRNLEYLEKTTDLSEVTDKLYHDGQVVIGTDCIGSCKSNYHTTTATPLMSRYLSYITILFRSFVIIVYIGNPITSNLT